MTATTAVVLAMGALVMVRGNSISDAGVQVVTQAILGSASLGQGILGSFKRECDR